MPLGSTADMLANTKDAAWFVRVSEAAGLVLSFHFKGKPTAHQLDQDGDTWRINKKDFGLDAKSIDDVSWTVCVSRS